MKVHANQEYQFRASYGKEIHYQRLALESRRAWVLEDEKRGSTEQDDGRDVGLFVNSGMLRIQPFDHLAALEKETLANMQRDGLRDTQFVKSDPADCERAIKQGWKDKILNFRIPDSESTYEAVLDSLAGFVRCSDACAHYQKMAADKGVKFYLGPQEGAIDHLVKVKSNLELSKDKVTGLKTKDGVVHDADAVVVAGKSREIFLSPSPFTHDFEAGSFSTQILPELSYHLESSAGSLGTFKIDKSNTELWDKYSPERFPVMTWKSTPRDTSGKDTGSIYVLPRTPEGLVKIGYRGIKVGTGSFIFILISTNCVVFSGPISNQRRTILRSRRTVNGQCLFQQRSAHYFQSQPCMLLSNLCLSSCLSSRIRPFSPRNFAGTLTRWIIRLW